MSDWQELSQRHCASCSLAGATARTEADPWLPLSQLAAKANRFLDDGLSSSGVRSSQYLLLAQIARSATVRPCDLARALCLSASTVTRGMILVGPVIPSREQWLHETANRLIFAQRRHGTFRAGTDSSAIRRRCNDRALGGLRASATGYLPCAIARAKTARRLTIYTKPAASTHTAPATKNTGR